MPSKIALFSGKTYDSEYDWDALQINAEDGNGFLKSKPFIEVFFKDYFVRGDGETFAAAEKEAWDKHIKIKSCKEHDFERLSDSGLGVCKHCGMRTVNLENLKKCKDCDEISYFFFGSENVCSKHFYEEVEKMNPPKDKSEVVLLKSYNTMKYIAKKYKNLPDKDLKDALKIYSNAYTTLMDFIEDIYEHIELDELFEMSDTIQTTYEYNKNLLRMIDGDHQAKDSLEKIVRILKKEVKV